MATNYKTIAVLWKFTQYIARGQSWMPLSVIVEARGVRLKKAGFELSQEATGMPVRTGSRDGRKCWETGVLWFSWSMRKWKRLDSSVWTSFQWTTLSIPYRNLCLVSMTTKTLQALVQNQIQSSAKLNQRSLKDFRDPEISVVIYKRKEKQCKHQTLMLDQHCCHSDKNETPK